MEKEKKNRGFDSGKLFIASIILFFCVLGTVVFSVSRRITKEMSVSAIGNLSESLDLIQGTIETILQMEAENQKQAAKELSVAEDPEEYIRSRDRNNAMVRVSLVDEGAAEGISNTDQVFLLEELDFSGRKTVEGLLVSQSYLNNMGTWAYTMKCPVVKKNGEAAELYMEYVYDFFDEALPDNFYNSNATLYIMDVKSQRFVLKPKGMGERDAGHLNLQDFCRANQIVEADIQNMITENIADGANVMFYHNVQGRESLIYMWSVGDGFLYLIGYVPVEAIQREGRAVKQNIMIVVFVMLGTFLLCCFLFYMNEIHKKKIRRERAKEREFHNLQLSEALKQAQIANSSKTTFLSNMSHDIRTPMNAILGFTTLLEQNVGDPERVREYTRKIMVSGRHLLGLINDILDVSKIESGKVVLTIDEFDLNHVLSSVDAIIRPAAGDKNQIFEITKTGIRHERLTGDETRLNQILLNLLSNAVKYTQEGGWVKLRVIGLEPQSEQYEHIRIEVEDNGCGMTPEYLQVIFDAFTRAENSTTNKVQGTGLGMTITKNIVELMGGTIEVASEVGRGSLFTVDLSLRIAEEKEEDQEEADDRSGGEEDDYGNILEGRHFLVAEDNEINGEILQELLDIEGATCEIMVNGQEAAERFLGSEPGSFDAVLMDVQMPVMNGYEATGKIRNSAHEEAGSIPIIAMTANAFAEDVKDAMDAGMDAHVAKPVNMDALKKALNQLLKERV
ncbi:MAG: response regulator [Lachnospiraceae bacterium]|nr:response regulator [Lachnospiraceae bacterium]